MDRDQFLALTLKNPVNATILAELLRLQLPDAWLVSGCLVQSVWNVLTGRDVGYGIADYDVFYFDADTSWAAEDAVIRKLQSRLSHLDVQVEARNQARVHLWYPQKHGVPYPPLACSTEGIDRFLTRNTQVGIRRTPDGHDVYAPHGFEDIARLAARPNPGPNFSAANYAAKVAAVAGDDGRRRGSWVNESLHAVKAQPDPAVTSPRPTPIRPCGAGA